MNTTTPLADPGTTIYLSPIHEAQDALRALQHVERLLTAAMTLTRTRRRYDELDAERAVVRADIIRHRDTVWGETAPVQKVAPIIRHYAQKAA